MSDLFFMTLMFLLGVVFGLSLSELITFFVYRHRVKKAKLQPMLGVVLPPKDNK